MCVIIIQEIVNTNAQNTEIVNMFVVYIQTIISCDDYKEILAC